MKDVNTTTGVLREVLSERIKQDLKFPDQTLPDGTADDPDTRLVRDLFQKECDLAAEDGTLTWQHILREEVFEAFAEEDVAKLRNELIQVAGVAVRWVEDIDRRNPRTPRVLRDVELVSWGPDVVSTSNGQDCE